MPIIPPNNNNPMQSTDDQDYTPQDLPDPPIEQSQDLDASGQPIPSHHIHPNNAYETGSSCHQCKSRRTAAELIFCTQVQRKKKGANPAQPVGCRKKYCEYCLKKFYSELRPVGDAAVAAWVCPSCRHQCTCAACRKKHEDQPNFGLDSGTRNFREERSTRAAYPDYDYSPPTKRSSRDRSSGSHYDSHAYSLRDHRRGGDSYSFSSRESRSQQRDREAREYKQRQQREEAAHTQQQRQADKRQKAAAAAAAAAASAAAAAAAAATAAPAASSGNASTATAAASTTAGNATTTNQGNGGTGPANLYGLGAGAIPANAPSQPEGLFMSPQTGPMQQSFSPRLATTAGAGIPPANLLGHNSGLLGPRQPGGQVVSPYFSSSIRPASSLLPPLPGGGLGGVNAAVNPAQNLLSGAHPGGFFGSSPSLVSSHAQLNPGTLSSSASPHVVGANALVSQSNAGGGTFSMFANNNTAANGSSLITNQSNGTGAGAGSNAAATTNAQMASNLSRLARSNNTPHLQPMDANTFVPPALQMINLNGSPAPGHQFGSFSTNGRSPLLGAARSPSVLASRVGSGVSAHNILPTTAAAAAVAATLQSNLLAPIASVPTANVPSANIPPNAAANANSALNGATNNGGATNPGAIASALFDPVPNQILLQLANPDAAKALADKVNHEKNQHQAAITAFTGSQTTQFRPQSSVPIPNGSAANPTNGGASTVLEAIATPLFHSVRGARTTAAANAAHLATAANAPFSLKDPTATAKNYDFTFLSGRHHQLVAYPNSGLLNPRAATQLFGTTGGGSSLFSAPISPPFTSLNASINTVRPELSSGRMDIVAQLTGSIADDNPALFFQHFTHLIDPTEIYTAQSSVNNLTNSSAGTATSSSSSSNSAILPDSELQVLSRIKHQLMVALQSAQTKLSALHAAAQDASSSQSSTTATATAATTPVTETTATEPNRVDDASSASTSTSPATATTTDTSATTPLHENELSLDSSTRPAAAAAAAAPSQVLNQSITNCTNLINTIRLYIQFISSRISTLIASLSTEENDATTATAAAAAATTTAASSSNEHTPSTSPFEQTAFSAFSFLWLLAHDPSLRPELDAIMTTTSLPVSPNIDSKNNNNNNNNNSSTRESPSPNSTSPSSVTSTLSSSSSSGNYLQKLSALCRHMADHLDTISATQPTALSINSPQDDMGTHSPRAAPSIVALGESPTPTDGLASTTSARSSGTSLLSRNPTHQNHSQASVTTLSLLDGGEKRKFNASAGYSEERRMAVQRHEMDHQVSLASVIPLNNTIPTSSTASSSNPN